MTRQVTHQGRPSQRPPASPGAGRGGARRRRLLTRGLPAAAVVAALGAGLVILATGDGRSELERSAATFAKAWESGDYAAMHATLGPETRERTSATDLARAYESARSTATVIGIDAGEPKETDGGVTLPVSVQTSVFGPVRGALFIPVEGKALAWEPHLVLPGLRRGEELRRRTRVPRRARILTRDGEVIAEGPAEARTSPLGAAGNQIAGRVAPAEEASEREELYSRGFDRDVPVGRNGLERILERRVSGTPGGALLAGDRELARTEPRASPDVRTSIDADVQRAATEALAGRFGGIAALDARTAEIRALAGIAFSAPQPPGSTFKIVTATAALEEGLVEPDTRFPVETRAVIDGVEIENANGESCGGTFTNSFAHSCNSVFAPLGVKIGAAKLVETATRFGFNEDPPLDGAAASTIPPADDIGSPLELGATAIGQGRLLATPLLLASIAQTIASEGVRRPPHVVPGSGGRGTRVTSRRIARQIERFMIAAVEGGTGVKAAIDGVKVAGKTGTAELEDTTDDNEQGVEELAEPPGFDTDAWFTAYAPSRRSKLAVGVLFVRNGAGGDTAAPAARIVLQASLSDDD